MFSIWLIGVRFLNLWHEDYCFICIKYFTVIYFHVGCTHACRDSQERHDHRRDQKTTFVWESALSFSRVGSGDCTEAVRHGKDHILSAEPSHLCSYPFFYAWHFLFPTGLSLVIFAEN